MNTQILLNSLINKQDFSEQEAFEIARGMFEGALSQAQIAGFLVGLAEKGESIDEITGFIKALRHYMVRVEGVTHAIDVCGTGGDRSGTFNISTAVSFVVAGCGVNVAKHGNRAATSKCGSADVLEALGVRITLSPDQAAEVLEKINMVFLFAPLFHPAFKHVAAVRRELGIKTIFNYIGPFANPAGVTRQLIGVPNGELAKKLAEVGRKLEYDHLCIVTGEDGLDEISVSAKTILFEVKGQSVIRKIIDPQEYGLTQAKDKGHRVKGEGVKGRSAQENAEIIKHIFSGEKGLQRDIVVLNSAFALLVAGKVKNPQEGIILAEKSIDAGSALKILESLQKETQKYA